MERDTSCCLGTDLVVLRRATGWVEAVEWTPSLPDTGSLSDGAAEDAEMVANQRDSRLPEMSTGETH